MSYAFSIFQWYRTEQDVPAFRMVNTTSAGTGEDRNRDGRTDYTDKPDPIREDQCNWCMMCVSVCPTQAIEVYQENKIYHQQQEPMQWKSSSLISELKFLETL